jgi:hypothetical protein
MLHILQNLVLQRRQLILEFNHPLETCQKHIETNKLPFGYTLRFLDICKRVTPERPPPIRPLLTEFTIFTLNHFHTLFRMAKTQPEKYF